MTTTGKCHGRLLSGSDIGVEILRLGRLLSFQDLEEGAPGSGHSTCKGPVAGPGLVCWRNSEEACVLGAE